MTYGYTRVSTGMQTVENQKLEISEWCERNNVTVDKWIDETISGTKDFSRRRLGKDILSVCKRGDVIVCSEISRLGRKLMMIMQILAICMERGISVMTVKEGYRLGDDIQSKVLAFAFSLVAEIERNLISSRTKEGLVRARLNGKYIGRPKGSNNKRCKFTDAQQAEVIEDFKSGLSINKISERTGISRSFITKLIVTRGLYTVKKSGTSSRLDHKAVSEFYFTHLAEETASKFGCSPNTVKKNFRKSDSLQTSHDCSMRRKNVLFYLRFHTIGEAAERFGLKKCDVAKIYMEAEK